MAKRFKDLVGKLPADRQAKIAKRRDEILREISLKELRQARQLTQQQLAETLHVNQAAVSKMEGQSDMYISTLRRFLEAMGGKLKVVAEFSGHEIIINQFRQEDSPQDEAGT